MFLLPLILMWLVVGCKPRVPSEYIRPGVMEDILYDYHLAQSILQQENGDDLFLREQACKQSILQKYGVTEAQFESSLQYYMRHTERLQDIYEKLAERLEDEAMAQGASVSDINSYGAMTARGDTANIWAGEKAFVLMPYPPYHANTFAFKADSAFHKGDRLIFSFDSQFIIQEGARNAAVVFAVKFGNDSIATQMQNVTTNMHYALTIEDREYLGIKEVKGYIVFNQGQNDAISVLRLLCIMNVQLVRMHKKELNLTIEPPVGETQIRDTVKADSVTQDRQMDSLRPMRRDSGLPSRRVISTKRNRVRQ